MKRRLLVLAVVSTLVVAACASADGTGDPDIDGTTTSTTMPHDPPDDGGGDGGSSGTEPNGEWILVSGAPVVDGYPISLTIADAAFGGRAACNQYGGSIDIDDDVWSLGQMSMTEMACEPAVMESEQAFLSAMAAVDGWVSADGALTLTGPDPELVFERAPEVPTEALVGTEWTLETIIIGDAATSTVGEPAVLVLSADGTVSGSTGCRDLVGTWIEADGQIFFPEFGADGECPPDIADQDSIVVTVLGDGFRASIDGTMLTLTSMGNEGLVYRAS